MSVFGKYVDYLAYHCDDCGATFLARLDPYKCKFCGSNNTVVYNFKQPLHQT